MKRLLASICVGLFCLSAVTSAQEPAPARPRVLIISIDGLRPDCMLRAEIPNIRKLMSMGSFSMWCRTTDVAITLPSHASMLTGVTPEKHGIDYNGDPPEGARVHVPTLFDLAKARGYTTALASGKRKFTLFGLNGSLDYIWTPKDSVTDDDSVAGHAATIIREHKPEVMYVHFGATDATGHSIGWGTPEQIGTIGLADRALGKVLDAVRDVGHLDDTTIILSADHGGTVRSHGRDDIRSHFIPWIAVGPGIRSDFDLTRLGKDYDLATFDTFATACYVLGLDVPSNLDGQPVTEMFIHAELMQSAASPATQPAAQPATQPATQPADANGRN